MSAREKSQRRADYRGDGCCLGRGDYKLIHYLKENKSLLFDLKEDPGEFKNLAGQETEITQRLLAYLKARLKQTNDILGRLK